MRASILALTAATTASVALAQPHKHQHAHLHEMNKRTQTETSWISGPTAYAFMLDGKSISVDEVCNGVASNKLKWADAAPAGLCSTSASASSRSDATSASSTAASTSGAAKSAAAFYQNSSSRGPSSAATSTVAVSSASDAPAAASSWGAWNASGSGQGVDSAFPDGELDCSNFPSSYGAVALDYLGMGGWSGLQAVTFGSSAITHIVTGISGETCTEGMMCSYACPPGYQKSQWPSTQGSTGQSVGGIQCKGGKLHLTNSALSPNLCIPGEGGVEAKNSASGVVAICRTDYPGTESETIPVELQSGETNQLANPNAGTYYTWQGKGTSAQYYLNPIGTSASEGCHWGTAGSNKGNWAPINFGVGYKDGKTWLSIFQNKPTTTNKYEGTVEIQGDVSDKCIYQNGQYCGATGCNADGCTVAVNSGTATFVVSD
ncbi:Sperm-associated antigen 4 protein [Exophiala xenobiotica]|uniref:Sperm-associated antigen 4 protein n=1 Tax=Lithohypha guttulata TaxID=1690604 RepID=A0ABR0KP84_9EURO|nr:Sperm-associated antigen 4 protein [Lithohypha guttulata]KAK5330842.1 Sperm-associated antigen 4 protein [Exophiala xenobiotica]